MILPALLHDGEREQASLLGHWYPEGEWFHVAQLLGDLGSGGKISGQLW